jgi:hypothetical protein
MACGKAKQSRAGQEENQANPAERKARCTCAWRRWDGSTGRKGLIYRGLAEPEPCEPPRRASPRLAERESNRCNVSMNVRRMLLGPERPGPVAIDSSLRHGYARVYAR